MTEESRGSDWGLVRQWWAGCAWILRAASNRWLLYSELARPITLLLPMVGIVSGGCTAMAASGRAWLPAIVARLAVGAVAAMLLNAASNSVNQVADLEVDRWNKPSRPLVRGAIGVDEALAVAGVGYGAAIGLAATLAAQTAALFAVAAAATLVYSLPAFGRTKRFSWGANLTVAIPRGCLLKVAGWSVCASVRDPQPWMLGAVFALFLLGATTSKDFADVAGDRATGCLTLPVRYGPQRAAEIIAPFFVLPWWLLPLGTLIPVPGAGVPLLSAGGPELLILAAVLTASGAWVAGLILRDPSSIGVAENHPAWTGMVVLALLAHLGLVLVYAL